MTRLSLPGRLKSFHGHRGIDSEPSSTTDSRSASPVRASASGAHHNGHLVLRIRVIKGRNLAPKDKHNTSDPYCVLRLGNGRSSTAAIHKSLNPEWNEVIDLPIEGLNCLLLEVKCWDKDRFGKDYMGEFDVALEDAFTSGAIAQEPAWFPLESRRKGRKKSVVTGEILLGFSLYDPLHAAATPHQLQQRLLALAAASSDLDDSDDALLQLGDSNIDNDSDDADEEEGADTLGPLHTGADIEPSSRDTVRGTNIPEKSRRRMKLAKLKKRAKERAYEFSGLSEMAGVLFLEISKITDLPPEKNMARTSFDCDPFVVTSLGKKTYRTKVMKHNLNPIYNEKLVFQVQQHETQYSLSFTIIDRDKLSGNDLIGNVNFPIDKVSSLAPEADPVTGLYALKDPENFGPPMTEAKKARFRLPLSRSSSSNSLPRMNTPRPGLARTNSQQSVASPQQRHEATPQRTNSQHKSDNEEKRPVVNRMLTDQHGPYNDEERPSANRMLTDQHKPNTEQKRPTANRLLTDQHKSNTEEKRPAANRMLTVNGSPELHTTRSASSGDQRESNPDDVDLTPFQVPIVLKKQERWQDKHQPTLHIRAKYLPYQALRQQFWRAMLKQYNADDSGHISKLELTTMLDTLGSTLRESTINRLFRHSVVENDEGDAELTIDQAVVALENLLTSIADKHKSRLEKSMDALAWSPSRREHAMEDDSDVDPLSTESPPRGQDNTSRHSSSSALPHPFHGAADEESDTFNANDLGDDNVEEHVVEVRECPICHQPRLTKKSDADIITHIATCASQDWRQVNNIVMAGFVTSSQAGRKWYSKVVSRIGYGGYKLGKNSANILVQDRATGLINEERMSVYVRLGIRLLYKGLKGGAMEKTRMRRLLRSLSYKQGRTYDNPASASQIQTFVNFHQLDMNEVLLSTSEFRTFNEFFYRKLKPDARPCSAPDNPQIITSPADCRSVVFNRIEEAQAIWIKGREFTIQRLLGKAYPDDAKKYTGGSLGIFRLAPQDYHRFHIPVDGVMDEPKLIEGEYYTVNPMAIRSALDVYGENVRVIVPIDSVAHGRVMVVCVGAMMVGSTIITRQAGEKVRRAEELGYFKFGGSTLLLLFEPGVMRFDPDMVDNSKNAIETLIRVGTSIGHTPSIPPHRADMRKNAEDVTPHEMQMARRRISGSFAPNMALLQGFMGAGGAVGAWS